VILADLEHAVVILDAGEVRVARIGAEVTDLLLVFHDEMVGPRHERESQVIREIEGDDVILVGRVREIVTRRDRPNRLHDDVFARPDERRRRIHERAGWRLFAPGEHRRDTQKESKHETVHACGFGGIRRHPPRARIRRLRELELRQARIGALQCVRQRRRRTRRYLRPTRKELPGRGRVCVVQDVLRRALEKLTWARVACA
jgi:hypothetical protein